MTTQDLRFLAIRVQILNSTKRSARLDFAARMNALISRFPVSIKHWG